MRGHFILTVDIGTTSSKALLVSSTGEVAASAQEFYPIRYPLPGYAEQDPYEILHSVTKIIRACAEKYSHQIRSICFSCAMHSLLAVDRDGKPLTPIIIWSDMRSWAQSKALKSGKHADLIYFKTGTPIHPMSPLCKLLWIKENQAGVFNSAFKFISIKEFILHQFTGNYLVYYSIASATGLFDVHQLKWSTEVLGMAGLDESKLSTCVSPYHRIDSLRNRMAGELGLPQDTSIIIGASDGCLANLGSDAMNAGDLSLTVGTSGAVRMATTKYADDPKKRIFNYRLDESTFIAGGATNNGTILLDWFSNNFNQRENQDMEEFVQMAMEIPAGAQGLVFLPYVFGERAPYYNTDFRGVFFGLAQHHTSRHMMRSLLEGICFEIRGIVESVEQAVGKVDRILGSGGFIRSVPWVQLLADVLHKEILLRDVHDASSLGAARMAYKALKLKSDFRPRAEEKIFTPNTGTDTLYNDLYAIFLRTTEVLNPEFERLRGVKS